MVWLPALLSVIIIVFTFFTDPHWRQSKPMKVDPSRIKDSLTLMKDWASWMAGIQTALLGAIAYLLQDALPADKLLPAVSLTTFVGIAVLSSSYVLASIPSVMLRIPPGKECSEKFDIYEMPLFNWTTKLTLGYVAAIQHVFWFLGILSAAWFFLAGIRLQ